MLLPSPDVGELQPLEPAEALPQRHQVGERLARVVLRGEHVDHRHRGVLGQLLEQLVRAGAHRRSRARSARARARCRAPTRRARAAALPRAAPPGGRPARTRRPRTTRACASTAARTRAPRSCPRARASRSRSAFSSSARSTQGAQLVARKLLAGQKVPVSHMRVLSWNLYHGRDFPPDPALLTLRSRLLGRAPSAARPTRRSTARCSTSSPRSSTASTGTSPCSRRRRRAGLRGWPGARASSGALVLTSRNWWPPLRGRAGRREPRPDRVQRGRLEPDARARARARRSSTGG